MGRRRVHVVTLPSGVHRVVWKSGRAAYYWRPGRGTSKAGVSIRLPDDPNTGLFWERLEAIQKPAHAAGGIAHMIDAYIGTRLTRLAESTQREYRRYLTSLRDSLGHCEPDDLEPRHVAEFRDELIGTPAKANAYVRCIAALYSWGRERGFARHNPADGITKLKGGEHQPWPQWTWDLVPTMRSELRIACYLGLYTGQRLGDVLEMQLGHIRNGLMAVRQAKTKKTLQIPLHRELLPIVAECRERGALYLVSKPNGKPYSVDQFHAMWGREMRKEPQGRIRREGFVFHGLRKSATVKLAEAGCTEKEIASVTGQSLAMVAHYSKGADQLRLSREAIRKMEGR